MSLSINHELVNPSDWEQVDRFVIVRLGPDWEWYENSAHGSQGIVSVTVDSTDRSIVVETDFVDGVDKILHASANVDASLALKGIFVGASGGSRFTRYTITSFKDLPGGYPAGTKIRPNGSCFDSTVDNLWIRQTSLRPREVG